MKAYKCNYNETSKKLEIMEFDVDHEFDFSHDPSSNIVGEDGGHTMEPDGILEFIRETNEDIVEGSSIIFKCRDCGKYEIMEESEIQWYAERDYKLPKRCFQCRRKKRK